MPARLIAGICSKSVGGNSPTAYRLARLGSHEKVLLRRRIKFPRNQLNRKSLGVSLCSIHAVTPAKAGVQFDCMSPVPNHLDSGFHRNDDKVRLIIAKGFSLEDR